MRFVIVIPGTLFLLGGILLIGITRTTPIPDQVFPSPKTAAEFVSRGELYEKHNKLEKALADYEQATKLEPSNSKALLSQASMLGILERPEAAISKYQLLKQLYQQKGDDTAMIDYSIREQQQKLKTAPVKPSK
jgi:cytochrome c-type biogenesis protein CcmH/NrfG